MRSVGWPPKTVNRLRPTEVAGLLALDQYVVTDPTPTRHRRPLKFSDKPRVVPRGVR